MRYGAFSMLALLMIAGGLLVGCQTDGAPSNPLAELAAATGKKDTAAKPSDEPPMTRSQAAMECWMQTEKGSASANLDKRADVVSKCIDDKLKKADAPKS